MLDARGSGTSFTGSMLSQVIFFDAYDSLIWKPKLQLCRLKRKRVVPREIEFSACVIQKYFKSFFAQLQLRVENYSSNFSVRIRRILSKN